MAALLLPDSGHLQEEDARRANQRGWSKHKPALPLYTAADAQAAVQRLQPFAYDPNKAKQMIADLKLPADFTLRFTAPDGNFPKDKEVAQAVADFLRAAGGGGVFSALTTS